MKHELWKKGKNVIIVGVASDSEYRYRFDGTTYYISGMSLYTLINDGWTKLKLEWL